MRNLYLTHDPAELVMAWLLFSTGSVVLYVVVDGAHLPIFLRFFIGQFVVIIYLLTYVFLFTMSGSRKRREAADSTPAIPASQEAA